MEADISITSREYYSVLEGWLREHPQLLAGLLEGPPRLGPGVERVRRLLLSGGVLGEPSPEAADALVRSAPLARVVFILSYLFALVEAGGVVGLERALLLAGLERVLEELKREVPQW